MEIFRTRRQYPAAPPIILRFDFLEKYVETRAGEFLASGKMTVVVFTTYCQKCVVEGGIGGA